MVDKDKSQQDRSLVEDEKLDNPVQATARKKFVEPEISQPVDVLEATTFFQAVDSGATN